jgi:uncharacterized protein
MISLSSIDTELQTALKERNQIVVDTLRGLKTRLANERIATGKDLTEDQMVAIVASEVKRRREAMEAFQTGGREEMAAKEKQEAEILAKFMPPQASEADIRAAIDEGIAANSWAAKDFGAAMGQLKGKFGAGADGALIAKLLKEKLS